MAGLGRARSQELRHLGPKFFGEVQYNHAIAVAFEAAGIL
jgi:hypothetical protein